MITTERNYGDEPNDADTTREVHPPPCHRCLPSWFRNVEWPDFKRGRSLAGLLEEVYSSIASGNHRVAMMGARAVMEAALEMKGVSGNNFTEILENAERGQHITPDYKKQLSAAVGMGHAATHRSYIPKTSQLESVLDIIENMLYMFFHAGPASAALSAATPPRAKPAA